MPVRRGRRGLPLGLWPRFELDLHLEKFWVSNRIYFEATPSCFPQEFCPFLGATPLRTARTYDPRLAYRSADWVALVEVLRMHARISGIDHNRKLLLNHIQRAQMLDDLAKMALLRALTVDREPDLQTTPLIDFALLPPEQRQEIADHLHDILSEMEGLSVPAVGEMIEDLECRLQCRIEVDAIRSGSPDFTNAKKGFMLGQVRWAKALLWRAWRSMIR